MEKSIVTKECRKEDLVMIEKEVMKITAYEDSQGDTYFRVLLNKEDKEAVKKLTYTDFCKMMMNAYQEPSVSIPVGRLPEYYIDSKVSTSGNKAVFVYIPAQVRPFYLANGDSVDSYIIPFPPMVLELNYGGGYSTGNMYCVKGTYQETLEDYYEGKLDLFLYPFGNVSSDGHVCMGNMRVEVTKATDVDEYISRFFDSITNYDYVANSKVTTKGHTQGSLVGELNGKEIFPVDWLKASNVKKMPYKNN